MSKPASSPSSASTLGLEGLGDLSALLETPPAAGEGRPLELRLDEISEDPAQPRVEFDPETLAELADSIRERGVKTPISVRRDLNSGGYIINHGARRYRASGLAGRATIPAYLDPDYTDEDQVVENIHRDALRPREIADYLGRKLAQGRTQKDLARALGKSKAWVSQHAALLDLPEAVAAVFNSGQSTDVTAINELARCHREDPQATASWLATQEVSRGTVKRLQEFIAARARAKGRDGAPEESPAEKSHRDPDQGQTPAATLRRPVVSVECGGKPGTLLYSRRPTRPGCVWVCVEKKEIEVKAEKLKLISVGGS